MSITLSTALASLITNKRRVSALKSLGVTTVGEALTYFPFRVTDPVRLQTLRQAQIGQQMAFVATVRDVRVVPGRMLRVIATVDDVDFARTHNMPGGTAQLTFFGGRKNYIDWVSMRLKSSPILVVSGVPSEYMGQLQFTHPDFLTVAPPEFAAANQQHMGAKLKYDADSIDEAVLRVTRPRPVYHASSRISSEHIHETILNLLWMMGARTSASQAALVPPSTSSIAVQPEEGIAAGGMIAQPEDTAAGNPENSAAVGTLAQAIPDILPESVRAVKNLMHRAEAFLAIHDPDSRGRFNEAIATLRYEEAFISQVSLLKARSHAHKSAAHSCPLGDATANTAANTAEGGRDVHNLRDQFISALPFALTAGQRQVIDDIAADLSRDWPMQRLLQGEVGSGKTVVALAAMLQAVGAGYQAVLVAPTQVLAEQHAETIGRMVAGLKPEVPVTLLTGGMKLAARRKALAAAASGEPGIIVATHAAFSKTFQAPHLALVVIDEQHRFGVEQRESLNAKTDDGTTPHLLVMTATPIPRTAAMTWFGDLDISWLTELPGGRKPIRTVVVNEADAPTMVRMLQHIRARVDAGERAYIVCPRIDEDNDADAAAGKRKQSDAESIGIDNPYETYDDNGEAEARPPLHSVEEIAGRLQKLPQFAGIQFATLTGRDKDDVKTQVMADFAAGKTPILVSTTVIEVGVDVKQASCIVIFDADRYGLSQLHQLRGRVGRGGTSSWAFLISRAESGSIAEQRLEVIHNSLDGAEIAQADLEFRGAGDVLGDAQSGGKSSLKLLRVVKDADMIADARARAERVLVADPELTNEVQLAGAVLDFTRGNETFLTSN
ncbi:ATP-dependent DNA helicase RecG [Bifidobacterium imperatoris]|uniref:ATP-dependent DNA helicase n=1 Tax=Bifidobacterium imperatoris TaxID=2020965 RepID=A0A2N5ISZ6_9BIFI|nr:ATP-dependent DNA helicase RecG [Bifidobacterium imperatoris]PLS25047.1 ATP-dependent DNA helicase [Bifidobacterium imperatoris]QSY58677.1 ATP-dependent DNA helicase RecG [Bifidobacterium imperatoris]